MLDAARRTGQGLGKPALCLLIGALAIGTAGAHGGGLDACGGHHDRKHGSYHVHNSALYRACQPTPAPPSSQAALTRKAPPAQAALEDQETRVVWVTATGTRYHRETCRSLTATRRAMSLAEATVRHTPCAVCRPDARTLDPAVPPSASAATGSPAALSSRCAAITKKGTRCSRAAREGSGYCWQHAR